MTEGAMASDRFERLMLEIRGRIDRRQFGTWFDRASLVSWDDADLVVGLPNKFYTVWFTSKFSQLVREAAESVARGPVKVRFEVVAGEEPAREAESEVAAPAPGASTRVESPATPPHGGRIYPAPFAGSGDDDVPLRLNELYTFDNYIIGPSNSVAHASARAVAQNPGRAYNPLFVHGSVGLGKTHLLHAICHDFTRRFPGDRICLLSCEEFTNEFVRALQRNDIENFRARFRNVHLLVIDDIHFLEGKERTQEEFFHTFNQLYQSNRQIVLSSDAAPNEIPTLEERLVSRFGWGLVSQLEQPEMETRMAIVRRKAELMHIDVSNDVVEFIASHFRNNIRELEGALLSTKAFADVQGTPVTMAVARAALRQSLQPIGMGITLEKICQVVCGRYQAKASDLRSKRRGRSISEPRQVIMFLARRLTSLSLDEIGNHFGGRDHSTVLYAVRKIEGRYQREPAFAATLERMADRLGGKLGDETG
jgi:chromosomal replication initiator protein